MYEQLHDYFTPVMNSLVQYIFLAFKLQWPYGVRNDIRIYVCLYATKLLFILFYSLTAWILYSIILTVLVFAILILIILMALIDSVRKWVLEQLILLT